MSRIIAFLLVLVMGSQGVLAQTAGSAPAPASSAEPGADGGAAPAAGQGTPEAPGGDLPVSLDRIRKQLAAPPPAIQIDNVRDRPTFRVDVQERNRLQDILSSLDFSAGPTPAGGVYADEIQRVMFPAASNPLRQPLAAFSQGELLTVLIQTLAGTYLAKKVAGAVADADRAAAEAAARENLNRAVAEYCASQPNGGAGISLCTPPPE